MKGEKSEGYRGFGGENNGVQWNIRGETAGIHGERGR